MCVCVCVCVCVFCIRSLGTHIKYLAGVRAERHIKRQAGMDRDVILSNIHSALTKQPPPPHLSLSTVLNAHRQFPCKLPLSPSHKTLSSVNIWCSLSILLVYITSGQITLLLLRVPVAYSASRRGHKYTCNYSAKYLPNPNKAIVIT